jgi:hypothetical protein
MGAPQPARPRRATAALVPSLIAPECEVLSVLRARTPPSRRLSNVFPPPQPGQNTGTTAGHRDDTHGG